MNYFLVFLGFFLSKVSRLNFFVIPPANSSYLAEIPATWQQHMEKVTACCVDYPKTGAPASILTPLSPPLRVRALLSNVQSCF
jgi:hypothetical protein